jgi:tRNA (uracil-5-)-methyltransferase TRM9
MENQQELWDKIALDWYKFRRDPKIIPKFLEKKTGKILDLGSGAGRSLIDLKTKGEMYLVDFSKEMIKLAKKRAKKHKIDAKFFVSDIVKLPFKDNFFDTALFLAVLHCIESKKDRAETVKELFRVLKPGAKTIVTVWNKDSKWFKNKPKEKYVGWRDKGKRYYYLYEEKELHNLFKKIGFKLLKTKKDHRMIIFIAQKP